MRYFFKNIPRLPSREKERERKLSNDECRNMSKRIPSPPISRSTTTKETEAAAAAKTTTATRFVRTLKCSLSRKIRRRKTLLLSVRIFPYRRAWTITWTCCSETALATKMKRTRVVEEMDELAFFTMFRGAGKRKKKRLKTCIELIMNHEEQHLALSPGEEQD